MHAPLNMRTGVDIRQLDVRWLRGKIGCVSQEPTLMDCRCEADLALTSHES
jgi:ABC-type bacteriocin/lantibiotic exporter with double-glycine peptidase domain